MNSAEIIFGAILAIVLIGLAIYFAWRQRKTLERSRKQDLDPEDRLYVQRQVQRRLLCSVLMILLAAMLVGWFFLEGQVREPGADEAERKNTIRFVTFYWIGFLLVLLVILFLAAMDFLAIARFGLRHKRRLEAEHRATLERDATRLRQERNGDT